MSADTTPLAGTLRLRPGARDSIVLARPDAARLAVGRPAQDLPLLLGLVFTLCSHAHRFTATLALDAARGRDIEAPTIAALQQRRAAHARDQLLRIAHDWPRLLGRDAAGRLPFDLGGVPLPRAGGAIAANEATHLALSHWLAERWLGMPVAQWLSRWDCAGADWADDWCESAPGPLAGLLRGVRGVASAASAAGPAWLAQGDVAPPLAALAPHIAQRREFAAADAVVPDTGPWSRRLDPRRAPAHNAWVRLTSRLADLLRLAAPGGERWLCSGALPVGPGEGLAWSEMARGVLVHWVRLEAAAGGPRVADCRVLAPTDLNFHPRGVLARALAALRGDGSADAGAQPAVVERARVLAAAFDPCLHFEVMNPRDEEAAAHA